ncbi:MAG: preprotein translocase subunit SecG [Parvibaculum sp.]|nr:preprotein translocase subunit SecG [Parvibaculum sp.]
MTTILLIIHLMVALVLVALVLLQRSEGGALGIGGGGGGGGLMSGRGAGNVLTRATGIVGAIFFVTSLALVILATRSTSGGSLLDNVAPAPAGINAPAPAQVPAPLGSGLDTPKAVAPAAPTAPAAPAEPSVPRAQ